ncbi:HU family DNA-binding protein [Deinococcus kurensis]|uniref:HU family DNA-binding protein n=1 Tax=Deinococcus kurensis TaxID=2662757 RepID=UPI0012D3522F|nr:HU family DNA-binding protein [Deinococcus kurensis]
MTHQPTPSKIGKKELVDRVCVACNLNRRQAAAVVDAFLGSVTEQLQAGTPVTLYRVGTLRPYTRAARRSFNLHTQEHVTHPPIPAVRFSPGVRLKPLT